MEGVWRGYGGFSQPDPAGSEVPLVGPPCMGEASRVTEWIWEPIRPFARLTYLRQALVGGMALLLIAAFGTGDVPLVALGCALLALWLSVSALATYLRASALARGIRRPHIPLRFSGPMGRFVLRRRDDGRHVEVVVDGVVAAEVKATDARDEIDVRSAPTSAQELLEFGSALGQAIEMASAADAAHEEWDDHSPHDLDEGRPSRCW